MSRWLPLRRRPRVPAPAAPTPDADPEEAAREAAAAAAAAERLARIKQYTRRGADPRTVLADVLPGIEDLRTRTATVLQAAPIARRLRSDKHLDAARAVAEAALAVATGPDLRASLTSVALGVELDGGTVPDPGRLSAGCRDLMAIADRHLDGSTPAAAAPWLLSCLELLFHRTLHCDDLVSPLADDAGAFLAPLHGARTYRRLAEPPAEAAPGEPVSREPGRPLRLLFVTATHWQFLEPVVERFTARDDVEVRRLELGTALGGEPLPPLVTLASARLAPAAPAPAGADGPLALLEWADTVFVEWCDAAAVWASVTVPAGTRLVVRLHSVEALSLAPQLVDWSRVDDLVTVSTPLDALVAAVAPASRSTRRHVLPNPVPLSQLPARKAPAADRTLAMVGWASPVKDPMFALDVLAALRRDDPAWRLLLIGGSEPPPRPRSLAHQERVLERLRDDPDLRDAVEITGHVADVARDDVGFVLSTSLRESFHVGLVQLAASGAVPVVRDWPVLRGYGGPRELFPASWIVEDVPAAVRRVLRFADPARRAEEGAAARRAMLDRYDWPRCAPGYDALLLT